MATQSTVLTSGHWRPRPRSIIGFVLAAFAGVALPLIVAIGTGLFYVDALYQQSERLVIQGMTVTRESRQLATLLTDMERSARQYQILGETKFVDRFAERSAAFRDTLERLDALEITDVDTRVLAPLYARVTQMTARLRGQQPDEVAEVIDELDASQNIVGDIAARGRSFVRDRLNALQGTARTARWVMLVCLFALVPIVILLAVALGFAIARPLREIVAAIRGLGEGRMSERIEIGAPVAELDQIGERLDWMRARLADQEAQKQQFLRHMSHELKTPLASIREGATLLVDGSLGGLDDGQREVATLVDTNAQALARQIDNLLNFAAWQETKARLEIAACDVTALIAGQVAQHRLTTQTRRLTIDVQPGPIEFALDADRFQLIVDNLLTNALKYAPEGSVVVVRAAQNADGLDLYVADQGRGVAESDRLRIWHAFTRGSADAPGQAHVSGTGIGLSVVRECAEAHGGYARVIDHMPEALSKRTRPSCFSVFHVHIPRAC
ncbi:ATP-binding protein [uncultured Salinisphaera sp.]|uniref:sensor histidine kinase n=1 Tax=uncultured Salinisphaera sp. TaxID=359372 RepID=UPI0032B28231|tara:strand:- start:78 stop:1574 length:1497 start_codon:yes stop_codon:yes gene_type:complete